RESIAVEIANTLGRTPFDCRRESMRGAIARLGPDTHVLILSVHHLFCDNWSMGVLSQELRAQYEAELRGLGESLPPLEMTYGDYLRRHADPAARRGR